jgi:hypothetical protein
MSKRSAAISRRRAFRRLTARRDQALDPLGAGDLRGADRRSRDDRRHLALPRLGSAYAARRRLRAHVHIGLAKVVAPGVKDGPIAPASGAPGGSRDDRRSPPAVDPDAIPEEARMKESGTVKGDEARSETGPEPRMRADESRVKTTSEAGMKPASEATHARSACGRRSRRRQNRHEHRQRRPERDCRRGNRVAHVAPLKIVTAARDATRTAGEHPRSPQSSFAD